MNDHEIDKLLSGAKIPEAPPSGTLGRIAESVAGSIRPVRPLPPPWLLAGGVVLICLVVALAGAAALGFFGFAKMSVLERGAVFTALAILSLASASEMVKAMIPASRRRISSGALFGLALLCVAVVLAVCFRNYQTTRFWHAGLVCLGIGVLHAIPAGLMSWLLLRRGFAVDSFSAGLAGGTVAGLAGIGMLELHCPNFQAAHVLVWHVGVLLTSAALGALCGRRATST